MTAAPELPWTGTTEPNWKNAHELLERAIEVFAERTSSHRLPYPPPDMLYDDLYGRVDCIGAIVAAAQIDNPKLHQLLAHLAHDLIRHYGVQPAGHTELDWIANKLGPDALWDIAKLSQEVFGASIEDLQGTDAKTHRLLPGGWVCVRDADQLLALLCILSWEAEQRA